MPGVCQYSPDSATDVNIAVRQSYGRSSSNLWTARRIGDIALCECIASDSMFYPLTLCALQIVL